MGKAKKIIVFIIAGVFLLAGAAGIIAYGHFFGAPRKGAGIEQFIVPLNAKQPDVIKKLREQGFIRSSTGFDYALKSTGGGRIKPGGYEISKSMNVFRLAEVLTNEPRMNWVVVPEGLRKEQVARILAENLGWDEQKENDWVTKYTDSGSDHAEGVYFPDTYLIPKDEALPDITKRFTNRFNEKFAPYAEGFAKNNIRWTTALKIAALVQREAAGKEDMPLIAGIFWNRLLQDMKLDIDATVQYARDSQAHYSGGTYKSEGDWWLPIDPRDKQIDSPYNTYKYKGLPPHPIANPGIDAIDAVLNSEETDCLFYLHGKDRRIHCASTYEKHMENIAQYLK